MIGRTLGGYRIVEQIGIGGMATVYKAYDASTDRYVAIKTLPHQYSKDPQFVERFRREAMAVAKLEHLHILPLFAFGEDDGVAYLVMRYLRAGTLGDRIRQMETMPLEEVARLIGQIASALDHAHTNGVLHRDVKSSNVLVDGDGNAYLTDFGLARMVEGTLDLTGDAILGTPQYMSPEQCQGRKDLTPASDQYSLGVVLYEMVTGQTPFQAETPLAVIHMQLLGTSLPLPSLEREDLPDIAESVILKALSREPSDRYPSCGALAKAFTAAIREQTLVTIRSETPMMPPVKAAVPPTLPTPVTPTASIEMLAPARRLPLVWIGGTAVLIMIAIVALLSGRNPAAETITPEETSVALVASSTPVTSPTPAATLAPTKSSTDSVTDLIAQGDAFSASQDYEEAIAAYDDALKLEPDNVDALTKRGEAYYQSGDSEGALIDFARALEIDPNQAAIYQRRAALYEEQGNTQAAIDDLTAALAVTPEDSDLLVLRGKAYIQYGNVELAQADLNQAITLSPELAEAYVQRAITYLNQGDNQTANADLTQAIKLDPDRAEVYALRGQVYRDENEFDLALGDYRKAIELDPENPQWHADRATVYEWRGDLEEAIVALDRAIELDPQFVSAYIQRAEDQRYRSQYDLAMADYQQARSLDPTNIYAYQGAVETLLYALDVGQTVTQYDLGNATDDANRAVELEPENSGVIYTRGRVLSLRGYYDEAIRDFTRAIELYPEYADAYIDRGDTYMQVGNFDLAAADYNRVIELYPEYTEAYYGRIEAYLQSVDNNKPLKDYDLNNALDDANHTIELDQYNAVSFLLRGKVYGRRGDYEAALTDLNQAVEMSSEMAWAYVERGYVYGSMGEVEKAVADYEQAIKLDPHDPWTYAALGDILYDNERRDEALTAYQSYAEQAGDDMVDYIRERINELEKQ